MGVKIIWDVADVFAFHEYFVPVRAFYSESLVLAPAKSYSKREGAIQEPIEVCLSWFDKEMIVSNFLERIY